jgi:hypothetical protein
MLTNYYHSSESKLCLLRLNCFLQIARMMHQPQTLVSYCVYISNRLLVFPRNMCITNIPMMYQQEWDICLKLI